MATNARGQQCAFQLASAFARAREIGDFEGNSRATTIIRRTKQTEWKKAEWKKRNDRLAIPFRSATGRARARARDRLPFSRT